MKLMNVNDDRHVAVAFLFTFYDLLFYFHLLLLQSAYCYIFTVEKDGDRPFQRSGCARE